ncbi:hypothetical protein SAY86_014970 [Trapa natans]|uniref:Uncharacterized protein n=1 Tax=Trapa natans TaxID=22666 RepID=A0AAN7KIA5_TRANT|nr:hypothetical protein SAY86_014970 [Trapa natans]
MGTVYCSSSLKAAGDGGELRSKWIGSVGARQEIVPAAVPAEDVHAGGGPADGRGDIVERGRHRIRRVAAAGVRKGPPPHPLQAQQLLQLRPAAQYLRKYCAVHLWHPSENSLSAYISL